jgi:lipoyl(octanoyl) transferase
MHALAERRLAGKAEDTLILLEHPPVFTAGRRWKRDHIVWTEERIAAAGAELRFVDRGGSLTFHGPGQLFGYPVVDLGPRPDAMRFVQDLEEVVIRASADVGVELHRSDVQTGVWAGPSKVCAIGVRLMRMRISLHGFALNCTTDLSWYDAIVPCGLAGEGVASLSQLAEREVTVEEMAPLVARRFEEVFERRLEVGQRDWPVPALAIPAAPSG